MTKYAALIALSTTALASVACASGPKSSVVAGAESPACAALAEFDASTYDTDGAGTRSQIGYHRLLDRSAEERAELLASCEGSTGAVY